MIDPPPILELKITDKATGGPEQDPSGTFFVHSALLNQDGIQDETEAPGEDESMPSTRRLMGTLVAAPYPAKDQHGIAGIFFVFPDLSCRSPGKYRLLFKLLRIDPMFIMPGAKQPCVASATTEVFSVYTAKDFPGMKQSSDLLKVLRRQGLNVGVKKGSEARKKGRAKEESGGDDDEDDEGSEEYGRGSNDTGETGSTGDVSPKAKSKNKGKRRRRDP